MNLKDKSILFYDYGLFTNIAQRLSRDYAKVYYHTPRESNYPLPNRYMIGDGIDGLIRCDEDSLWDVIDKVDLIAFPDTGEGALQERLRREGKRVFGCGRSERLELDRAWLREGMKKIGLPVIPYQVIIGVDNLRDYCRINKDKWIKISMFRGLAETYHHIDYNKSLPWIDRIAHLSGPYQKHFEFIVEDTIDGCEVGSDWFFSGGYLDNGMYGIEIKDKGYICKTLRHSDLPKPILEVDRKLEPILKKLGMQGMVSTEVRYDGKNAYLIDPCTRAGSPPSECQSRMYENYSEMFWNVAGSDSIIPKPIAKYGAQVILYSEFAIKDWCHITIPAKFKDRITVKNLCNIDGQHYIIPKDESNTIGSAVGYGKTIEEAQGNAMKAADAVKAEGLYYFENVFDEADEEIKKAKSYGVW